MSRIQISEDTDRKKPTSKTPETQESRVQSVTQAGLVAAQQQLWLKRIKLLVWAKLQTDWNAGTWERLQNSINWTQNVKNVSTVMWERRHTGNHHFKFDCVLLQAPESWDLNRLIAHRAAQCTNSILKWSSDNNSLHWGIQKVALKRKAFCFHPFFLYGSWWFEFKSKSSRQKGGWALQWGLEQHYTVESQLSEPRISSASQVFLQSLALTENPISPLQWHWVWVFPF